MLVLLLLLLLLFLLLFPRISESTEQCKLPTTGFFFFFKKKEDLFHLPTTGLVNIPLDSQHSRHACHLFLNLQHSENESESGAPYLPKDY
jgi:hypothetical protein